MNKYTTACLVLATGALTALLTAQTPAATPIKVGIIHLQSAIMSTKEGQAAAADLQKTMLEPRSKELEAKQTDIRDLQEKLQRGGNTMSETAKTDMQKTIEQKTKSLNRDVEDFNADRDEAESKIVDDLVAKMRVVIDKYAQENGYRVIMDITNPSSGVLYWATDADLTRQLSEAYDKTYGSGSPSTGKAPAAPKGTTPAKSTTPPPAKQPALPGQGKQ